MEICEIDENEISDCMGKKSQHCVLQSAKRLVIKHRRRVEDMMEDHISVDIK